MGGLILCKKKAEKPFYIELSDINIYSMEELCYYLYHNIYAINKSFFNEELFEFLRHMEETSLVQKLNTDILSGKKYLSLVWDIISCVDYYSAEEKEEIHHELTEIMRRTPAQNRKARADILRKRGKYAEALDEYYAVIEDETLKASDKNIADAWNNIGVMRAGAFLYDEAVRCFEKAMDIHEQEEYLDNIICAVIMGGKYQKDERKEKFDVLKKEMILKYHIDSQLFERYTEIIEREKKNILLGRETEEFQKKMSFQGKTDISQHYREVNEIVSEWKSQYREQEKERQSR